VRWDRPAREGKEVRGGVGVREEHRVIGEYPEREAHRDLQDHMVKWDYGGREGHRAGVAITLSHASGLGAQGTTT
jgi:hypothetical protein